MAENTSDKKKISPEFIIMVKKYIEIDDSIATMKESLKQLSNEKILIEDNIIAKLTDMGETIINVSDGKIKKNITKVRGVIKKNYIEDILQTYITDTKQIQTITDKIIESIPVKEKTNLIRVKK